MESDSRPHARATYETWKSLRNILKGQQIYLNGQDLDIAAIVAVSK